MDERTQEGSFEIPTSDNGTIEGLAAPVAEVVGGILGTEVAVAPEPKRRGRPPGGGNSPGAEPKPKRKYTRKAKTDPTGPSESSPDPRGTSEATAAKPPTSKLLSAARRVVDYQAAHPALTRVLDITLKSSPPSEIFFRLWPDERDDFPCYILQVKNDSDRKDLFIVPESIANLSHVRRHAKPGVLTALITTTGIVYVWARVTPNAGDNQLSYTYQLAMERVANQARRGWIYLTWERSKPRVEEPGVPITEEAQWPTGQPPEELYSLAIEPYWIDNPDELVIKRLNTKKIGE